MTTLGAYFGNDPSALPAYEAWLGHDVDHVLFYLNQSSWTAFDSSISWAVNLWKPTNTPVIWSVPLVVEGASLEQAAAGAFASHYLQAANALAASRTDSGPIYVRVGWEFNGDWMPWSAQGHEAAFIKAFQNVVDDFRSVSDRFRFVWDVNLGGSYDPAKAYPGDAYVDVVGMDFYYNTQWDSTDPHAAFQSKVTQPHGLQWQQDFAAAHGKQTAISEWGIQTDNAGPYIADAAKWFADHGMVFQNYWESDYAGYDGALHDDSKPKAGEAFRDAFGSGDLHVIADQTDPGSVVLLPAGMTMSFVGNHVVATAFHIAGDADFAVASGLTETLTGRIMDTAGHGSGILEKTGDGHLILSGANTYSGGSVLRDGELTLAAAGAAGTGTITFIAGEAATLSLTGAALTGSSHSLANAITGFGEGHTIDLLGVGTAVGSSFDHARGILTLQDGRGAAIAAFTLTGNYADDTFEFATDGHGGTAIVLADEPDAGGTLSLSVSQDAYQGNAQFIVRVDGVQVGGVQSAHASHALGQSEDIVLHGDFNADASVVSVQFINDAFGGSAERDRNLYVEEISVNGQTYAGKTASNSAGQSVGTDAGMFYNGSALFKIADTSSNSLTLTVSGDAYKGNAQFTVFVDGQQVGGIQTVQASHAAGQTQDIALHGDFGRNPGEVRVVFVNDLYDGTPARDRNLYVDALQLNGHHIDGAAGQNTAGWDYGHTAALFSNGSLVFHQSDGDWHI